MEGTDGTGGELHAVLHAASRLIRRDGDAFAMDGVGFAPPAEPGRRQFQAFGEQVADPFAIGDLLNQLADGRDISPREVDAVEILLRDDAALVTFHHPGDDP